MFFHHKKHYKIHLSYLFSFIFSFCVAFDVPFNSIFYFFLMRSILRQIVAVLALVGIATTMVPSTFAVTYTAQAAADKLAASGFIVDQSANPAAYRLADNLLRQEAVGTAAKIRGVLNVSIEAYVCTNHFSDVNASTGYIASLGKGWVCRAAELAANAGITNAANATFRPADKLTRFEALVFALRAADLIPSAGLSQSAIIQIGVDNGVITSSVGFNANAAATRGEFFQYTVRALDAAETPELCELLGICPNPNPNPTPTGGAVSISLTGDTPAATTIAKAANANFTKFSIRGGSTGTGISTIFVTRTGLSTNSMVENIKILDENMVQVSSTGSLNANNKAQLTFSPALVIPANTTKTFYIRAGITSSTGSGNTVALGIESAADIVSTGTVSGSFPVRGNLMTTLDLTIGTLILADDGTVTDSQPNVGDKDVVINKFSLAAGSVETVTIKQIAVERQGSASATDSANIELFDVSAGTSVGTVATWDANGLAVFNNLNILLDKGQTKRFEVRVDVLGGSGLTINGDLTDGSDARVQAIGNTYGFFLTPTSTMTNGQGAASQTVQAGTLTITKSVSTPAAGNISAGSDRHLATFDFQVLGEPMKITSLLLEATFASGTPMVYSQVTNVKLIDAATGTLLAGPKDLTASANATFTDVIILPVGTTKVKVTANLATSVANGDTILLDIGTPAASIVARGMQSNDTITPSPASDVSANTLTVQAATLTATTNTTPAARSIVVGQQDFIFATATLSAANSGEDILVSAMTIEDTVNENAGGNSGAEDIDNVEIWADLTAANSARGDVYETKVGDTKQFTGTGDGDALLSFNLTPTITVPKNGSVNIAIVADLSSSADVSDTHTISIDQDSGDVTASGKDTGGSVTLTPSGAGQAMTVATGGTLTVSVDSSTPVAGLMLDSVSEHTATIFRLAANNTENLDVDSIKITDDGSDTVAASYKFYAGATLLGTAPVDGNGDAELFLTDGQLVIPANDYKLVTVKAVPKDIGNGPSNGDTVKVTIAAAGDVDTTGLASGSAVDSTQTSVDGNSMIAFEAYPVVSFNNTGVETVLGANANYVAGKIVIENPGNKDITFDSDDALKINFEITGTLTTPTGAVVLKDANGTTLDTVDMAAATGSTSATITFAGSTLTVPAGQSKTLTITVNTAGLTVDGNTLQAWLSDDADANLEFSINAGTADYTIGTLAFRGDIYGVVHTNP